MRFLAVFLSFLALVSILTAQDDVRVDTETYADIGERVDFDTADFRTAGPSHDKKNSSEGKVKEDKFVDYEAELKAKEAEAIRQRKMDGRKLEGVTAVKKTIQAASSDMCDWKVQPIAFLKGEVCGSHYKVLGIDRRSKITDKLKIKKKYRQLSLQLHPDKNPAQDAQEAFSYLQGAYDCILDESCKEDYDQRLAAKEEVIAEKRMKIKRVVMEKSITLANQAHYYLSIAANRVYTLGQNFWEMMGEWEVTIFDETYPFGRPLAILVLLWKGQFLLKLHALSYAIIRINYEIAKARNWL